MSRRRLFYIIVPIIIIIIAVIGYVAAFEFRKPPLGKLHQAMKSLEEARQADAKRFAKEDFLSAERNLAAAQESLKTINNHWWPSGNYKQVDSLLNESCRYSKSAIERTGNKRQASNGKVDNKIKELVESLAVWEDILTKSLPRAKEDLIFRSASFNLEMARNMLSRGQYSTAEKYVDSVHHYLSNLKKYHSQYSQAHDEWLILSKNWVSKTLEHSKKRGVRAIIVDKSRHYLYLLSAGRVVDSMKCDLGYNSGYQKKISGDGATPEGIYSVKHINHYSKYYKAFLLNYPNQDDRNRFESNITSGSIPRNSKIGGLIEIHGRGGTGRDWTDGCVAVPDKKMDFLLRFVSTGTMVTIVRAWNR